MAEESAFLVDDVEGGLCIDNTDAGIDSLFDVYINVESAKELCDSLESKYMAGDSSSKKFLASNFNNYKMVDSRLVMEQYNELLRIHRQYTQHGLKMDKSIFALSINDKLHPSWKDFKHSKDDLAQDSDKGKGKEVGRPSVNRQKRVVRTNKTKVKSDPMRTTVVLVPTRNQSWNVGSVVRLVTSKGIAVVVKRTTQILLVRVRRLRTNPKTKVDVIAWWIDSGATTHVCKDCCWFKTFEPVEDGSVLYMGDEHFAPVHGKGRVALEFSSGKTITLFNVLYVPKLCNKKYVVTFIDDASRFCYVYLLHAKDKALDKFRIYKTEVELQQNDLIKTLRTDRGGKYYDPVFFQYVGVIYETTAPYTPQQNGMAERKNKALKEMVNSMLSYSGLSEGFWGEAIAVVRQLDPKRKTLGEKGIDCIFVGYAEHSKAYRFYIIEPNDSVSINSIIESRDAIFDENRFSSIPRPKDIILNSDESQRNDHSDDVPNEIPEPRKGKRVRKAKSYGCDFQLYLVEGSRDHVGLQYSYCYSIEEDPRTYNEAMQSRDSGFWKEAIDDEIGSIMENNTWVLSDLPPGCKPLGCKWIFNRKMKVDGTVDKFKARLVIQGFRQKEGIDYFDTYAAVARITTTRLLLDLTAIHNLVIHQMDVKIAFLNVDKTKKFLSLKFSMKDMGEADVILGIKIKRENKGIVITQSHYIEKILRKFNREDCSSVSTPMDLVEKLKPNTGEPVDQLEYSRAIGCLMYAMTSTRPDIAYVVGRLSRFTSNPSRQHWKAITRIFKYLRGTKNYGLSHVGYPSVLEGYSDASWINHVEDSSFTSGWVFLLGGGAISWASKKQTCITGSFMESEFIALAAASKEVEWLRNLIHEIPIWPKPIAPISIQCDSAPTIARAYIQIYNGKSRHLGVRHSMVRELIRNGVISIEFVRTQHNLADHLTKGLARDLVYKSVTGIGLKSI
nr:zinc finger, CCHC-type [Tanacetum cinerariifolium]